VSFTPSTGRYAGERCQGVFLVVVDREQLRSVRLGVEIAVALQRLYGSRFEPGPTAQLLGSKDAVSAIAGGADATAVLASWAAAEGQWRLLRAKYLLY
jgi:uncharacterized protein YbbC (DUF1343 family)